MNTTGYIKLYRSIQERPWYKDDQALRLYLHLHLNAAHAPYQTTIGNQITTVLPGQILTGRRKLAIETGINESKIERLLQMFQKCGEIEQRTNNASRLISVTYDHPETETEQQMNSERTANEHYNKNIKNIKKSEEATHTHDPETETENVTPEQHARFLALDQIFRENARYTHKITEEEFDTLLAEFLKQKIALQEANWTRQAEFRRHFYYWLPKNLQHKNTNQKNRTHASHHQSPKNGNLVSHDTATQAVLTILAERGINPRHHGSGG